MGRARTRGWYPGRGDDVLKRRRGGKKGSAAVVGPLDSETVDALVMLAAFAEEGREEGEGHVATEVGHTEESAGLAVVSALQGAVKGVHLERGKVGTGEGARQGVSGGEVGEEGGPGLGSVVVLGGDRLRESAAAAERGLAVERVGRGGETHAGRLAERANAAGGSGVVVVEETEPKEGEGTDEEGVGGAGDPRPREGGRRKAGMRGRGEGLSWYRRIHEQIRPLTLGRMAKLGLDLDTVIETHRDMLTAETTIRLGGGGRRGPVQYGTVPNWGPRGQAVEFFYRILGVLGRLASDLPGEEEFKGTQVNVTVNMQPGAKQSEKAKGFVVRVETGE